MEDRCLDHFRDVRAIFRRTRVCGQRGETDLVVRDDVNRAADSVALELRHVQHLGDNPLPGHRRVAVDQNRDDLRTLRRVAAVALACSRHADDNGIHGLEMARVCAQAHLDFCAGRQHVARVHVAEVILHIAVAIHGVRDEIRIEFPEHEAVGLPQKLHDDREPPAMRHAHRDLLHAEARAIFQHRIERRDERFAALDAEAFLPLVGDRVQETLERLDLVDVPQHPRLCPRVHVPLRAGLDAFAQPVAHARIRDVHELEADVLAENGFQLAAKIAQRHRRATEEVFRGDDEIEILLGEAKLAEAEQIILRALRRERVRRGDGVAERAVGIHEAVHACLKRGVTPHLHRSRAIRAGHALLELCEPEVKALAESAERWLDGLRILQPALVCFIEEI